MVNAGWCSWGTRETAPAGASHRIFYTSIYFFVYCSADAGPQNQGPRAEPSARAPPGQSLFRIQRIQVIHLRGIFATMSGSNGTVLVAALDWGLGHATRSVRIIRRLQAEGRKVILASAGGGYDFYKRYFPELEVIRKPGYHIKYYRLLTTSLSVIIQIPKMLLAIRREHRWLEKVIEEYKIEEVVSDNCYGLWNKKIRSVLITHQLQVKCPPLLRSFEAYCRKKIGTLVNNFDECQVPDFQDANNLSGELSHIDTLPSNVKFIGPLSRFPVNEIFRTELSFEVVVLLSGPEPQRSIFENKCREILRGTDLKTCILRGRPARMKSVTYGNVTTFNHANDEELQALLSNAQLIICRSGYSTMMDLYALGLSALLVPTPGQTEQEYLATYHSSRGMKMCSQDDLSLERISASLELYQVL